MNTRIRLSVVTVLLAALVMSHAALAAGRLNLRPLMRGIPIVLTPLKGNLGTESAAQDTNIDQFVNVGKGSATWSLILNFLVETAQGQNTTQTVAIPIDEVMGLLGQAPVVSLNRSTSLGTPITPATATETQGIKSLLQAHQSELGGSTVRLVPCQNLTLAVVIMPVATISTRPVHTESVNYSWAAELWDHVNAGSWWQWYDTGYFWVKWRNPKIQGAKGMVSTAGEWRCVKTWDYETGIIDDNKAAVKAQAEAYATQYGPELEAVPATGSLWNQANSGKASWGGGVVNWSCTYEGVFTQHKKITCRCVARGGHGG
jgi:hypothetical protein